VGSSIPAALNFARPSSVTTTPRFFGSRWLASESRNTCREPVQHFVRWTTISTTTDSLTRLMASAGDIAHSSSSRRIREAPHGSSSGETLRPTRAEMLQDLLHHPNLPVRLLGLLVYPLGNLHRRRQVAR